MMIAKVTSKVRNGVRKSARKSPFDKWVGRLKDLEGRRSDDVVKELRGHPQSLGRGAARRRRSVAGFTLVELVVVLGVLGLLAVLGLPTMQVWKKSMDLRNAATDVSEALLAARTRSVVERANYTVSVDYAGDTYAVTPFIKKPSTWGTVDLYPDGTDPDCSSFSGQNVVFRPNSTADAVGFEAAYLRSKDAKVSVRYRVKVLGATAKVSIERWVGGAWIGAY